MINYAIGWGTTVPQAPFVTGIEPGDWGPNTELETEWKKRMATSERRRLSWIWMHFWTA